MRALLVAAALLLVGCASEGASASATRGWVGEQLYGQLGFRFSAPLDMNGDDIADVAAGARFADIGGLRDTGIVYAWSGRSDAQLLSWDGDSALGLFGHTVASVPDLDEDGLADLVAAAPNRRGGGVLSARSPASGRVLWHAAVSDVLGWDLALAGDHDGDGAHDLFVGAPNTTRARVELRTGRTGALLRTYEQPSDTFGFYVDAIDDLDGDGLRDLLVGAPLHDGGASAVDVGAAFLIASGSGEVLRTFIGEEPSSRFGETVAAIDDIDGDGVDDVAVGAPHTNDPGEAGQVFLFSSATGELLDRLVGSEPGEIYGRNVARVYDVDGDGTDDIAIGAPWWSDRFRIPRAGRFEVVSGRTLEVLVSVHGEREGAWLGWHIVTADNMIDGTRRGLLVSSIRSEEGGLAEAGRIELYELSR